MPMTFKHLVVVYIFCFLIGLNLPETLSGLSIF